MIVFAETFLTLASSKLPKSHDKDKDILLTQKVDTKEQKCDLDFEKKNYSHVINIFVEELNKKVSEKCPFCNKSNLFLRIADLLF